VAGKARGGWIQPLAKVHSEGIIPAADAATRPAADRAPALAEAKEADLAADLAVDLAGEAAGLAVEMGAEAAAIGKCAPVPRRLFSGERIRHCLMPARNP
jgi:hypothetical protein